MRPNWPFKGWFTKIISEKKGEGWEWPPQPPLNPKHTHALLSFFFQTFCETIHVQPEFPSHHLEVTFWMQEKVHLKVILKANFGPFYSKIIS